MKKIIAITACPTGVAHTFMAAEKLEEGAKKLGYEIHVEKQGALGIEDKIPEDKLKNADYVILAVETKVRELERFKGKKVYYCPVNHPIKDNIKVFQEAEAKATILEVDGNTETKTEKKEEKQKSLAQDVKKHILTGISYIIPLMIGASVVMGIARIGAMFMGVYDIWESVHLEEGGLLAFFHILDVLGGTALGLMLPILAGFIAYSIADRSGLAAGMTGGMIAKNVGAGFFGAMFAGLFAGYFTAWLVKKIKIKGAASSIGPVFLIPTISILATCLVSFFIIGIPFAMVNQILIGFLEGLGGAYVILLAMLFGAMVGFDLGGPVNKAAVVTAMALIEQGLYGANTAVQVAIIIPTLGYGVATIIQGSRFSESFRSAGQASFIMGLVGISEGAIPFTLANPKKLVLVNCVGCAVGAAIAVGLGAINYIPISGIYGWLLVENWQAYVLAIAVGTAIVTLGALWASDSFTGDDVDGII